MSSFESPLRWRNGKSKKSLELIELKRFLLFVIYLSVRYLSGICLAEFQQGFTQVNVLWLTDVLRTVEKLKQSYLCIEISL